MDTSKSLMEWPIGRLLPPKARLWNWPAAGQGARTAVVAFGGFAIGYWGFGRLQIAVFATFGGLALTGIANFGGTMKGRFGANAVAGMAGVGLAALGTWASSRPVAVAAVVTFAVGVSAVTFGLLGGYCAIASNAVILYYLVAAGSPAANALIPDRVYGVLIGAAMASAASVALWPDRAGSRLLGQLAARIRRCGEALVAWDLRPDPPGTPNVRVAVDLSDDRPAGPTRTQRGALYLVNDLERLEHLLERADQSGLPAGEQESLIDAGQRLIKVADAVGGHTGSRPPDRPSGADPGEDGIPADTVVRFGIAYRALAVVDAIESHAAAIKSVASDPGPTRSARFASPVWHGAGDFGPI
jgi:hypothetical protein